MRIQQILETTTAGSVATVAQPMMTQTRENINVPGLKPVKQLMKGKAAKKGPYANSIVEGKVKELHKDLKDLTSHQFQEKYKQSKSEVRDDMKKVNEGELSEQDLIVIPGQGRLRKTGFVKHDLDQGEHEGHTLKNSLHTIIRVATHLDKRLSLQSEFPEWVSEKIGAVKSNMVTVMDYLISSQEMQHDPDAINELSSALLQRAAQAATDKRNQAMDPKLHNALGGGYMNPLATHYDDVSQKISNRAAKVGKKETIQKIASKIASPAVMRKMGMNEGSQRIDSLVTDALKVMKGPEISDAVLALKRVLGDRAYNERRGFYSFYIDQIHDMYGQQGVEEAMDMPPSYDQMSHEVGTNAPIVQQAASQAMPDMSKMAQIAATDRTMSNSNPDYAKERAELKVQLARGIGPASMKFNWENYYLPISQLLKKHQGVKEGKIDFAKKLQKNVDKHNKAVVQTKKAVGSRVADIGPGGKEYNVKTDAAWDAAKKKVSEGLKK
jgi:hypothetical protein